MKLKSLSIALLLIYVLIQVLFVSFGGLPFVSDSLTYLTFAQSAVQENTYYPNPLSLYSEWLVAPVYINWLIFLLKTGGGARVILFFNILLNTVQLILLYKVAEKIFNTRAAFAAGVLYVLYLNNLGLVLLNLTELPFGILLLASIYFFVLTPTLRNGLLCGFMAGLAIGVRPTAWALLIGFVIIYVIHVFQHKGQHVKLAGIVLGVMLYVIPMGLLARHNIGRFEFSSTTGPANLIMSANPKARGVFDAQFFHEDSIYLTKKTYVDRNEYLLSRSKEYIGEHPGSWIGLIPRKLYSTFISDGWAIPPLLYTQKFDLNGYLKNKSDFREAFGQQHVFFRMAFWTLNLWQQLIYSLIFVVFIFQLYKFVVYSFKRNTAFNYESLLINLFIAGGITLTIFSSVGNPRYKYNFLIVGIILISPYMVDFFDKFIYPLFNRGDRQKVG
jgi:Dolichyl-phosphate-mannose-protein mannosyltransferase